MAKKETGTEVATISQQASTVALMDNKSLDEVLAGFEEVATLVYPFYKPVNNRPFIAQIVSEPYEGKEIDDNRYKNMGTPTMIRFINLQDGIEYELMLKAVLKGILEETCEGDWSSLVGRYFLLNQLPKRITLSAEGEETSAQYNTWAAKEVKPAS